MTVTKTVVNMGAYLGNSIFVVSLSLIIHFGVATLFEVQQRATDFGALYAALVIVLVPTVILYLVGQKYLIGSLNVGGVKE